MIKKKMFKYGLHGPKLEHSSADQAATKFPKYSITHFYTTLIGEPADKLRRFDDKLRHSNLPHAAIRGAMEDHISHIHRIGEEQNDPAAHKRYPSWYSMVDRTIAGSRSDVASRFSTRISSIH